VQHLIIALILAGAFYYGSTEALSALRKIGANIETTDANGSRGRHADPSDPDGRIFFLMDDVKPAQSPPLGRL